MDSETCDFCKIVTGKLPRNTRYEDDELVVFDNKLQWIPVMLLVVPRQHLTQTELWNNGSLISRIATLAVSIGKEHCPNGFRILSNFGSDALQTQRHGHIHILGGAYMGHYIHLPDHSR